MFLQVIIDKVSHYIFIYFLWRKSLIPLKRRNFISFLKILVFLDTSNALSILISIFDLWKGLILSADLHNCDLNWATTFCLLHVFAMLFNKQFDSNSILVLFKILIIDRISYACFKLIWNRHIWINWMLEFIIVYCRSKP